MKLHKLFFTILILFASFQICFGQEFVEDENWLGQIEGGTPSFLHHRFNTFTQQDVINAKKKLALIKSTTPKDEWEGEYDEFGELSDTKLLWNSDAGFINYYIYTCSIELRELNYGKAINNSDSVILVTEKPKLPFFRTDKTGQIKLIKVKWGDRHYLVEEKDLETFCELAAGYYGAGKNQIVEYNGEKFETQISIWNSFWVLNDDYSNKKVFGLPILPKSHQKFIKQPIETKIISIGKYRKDKPTKEPVMTYSHRFVNINLGINNGIKTDMQFYSSDLDETITIVKVNKKNSVGVLERWIDDETQNEMCFKGGERTPCKVLKIGMKIKTIPSEFLEDN